MSVSPVNVRCEHRTNKHRQKHIQINIFYYFNFKNYDYIEIKTLKQKLKLIEMSSYINHGFVFGNHFHHLDYSYPGSSYPFGNLYRLF